MEDTKKNDQGMSSAPAKLSMPTAVGKINVTGKEKEKTAENEYEETDDYSLGINTADMLPDGENSSQNCSLRLMQCTKVNAGVTDLLIKRKDFSLLKADIPIISLWEETEQETEREAGDPDHQSGSTTSNSKRRHRDRHVQAD